MTILLAATDGSRSAGHALDIAARLAVATNAEVTILAVMQIAMDGDVKEFARSENATPGEILERETATILSRAKVRLAEAGVKQINVRAAMGDPAEIILKTAADLTADIVIVGKRGRGRLEGLLLGSVSQKIVSLAQCPVLVVP